MISSFRFCQVCWLLLLPISLLLLLFFASYIMKRYKYKYMSLIARIAKQKDLILLENFCKENNKRQLNYLDENDEETVEVLDSSL